MGSIGSQRLKEPCVAATSGQSVVTSFDNFQLETTIEGAQDPGIRVRGVPPFTDSAVDEPVPDDRYHAIYFAMLLAGVGFLLPYNSFITDVDYLHHKYPGTSIVFDMSLTYILVALAAVLLNNVVVERLNLHTRITTGYLLALGPLLFISIFDVWLQLFSHDQAYAINLAAVGTVAFGCTGTAGVMISLSRILTKLLLPDERASTIIFFLVSAGLELLCFLLHLLVRRSRFVLYYTTRPRDSRPVRAGYRVHHDVASGDIHFILAALPVDWRGTHLLACSCLRVVFIPLFILCVYPTGMPALRHPAWPCVFSLLMGISNGYFGSVPMILAAGKVSPKQRELAGNTMTVSYMSGLTLGSAVAYCTYSLTRDAHSSCFQTATANDSILVGP